MVREPQILIWVASFLKNLWKECVYRKGLFEYVYRKGLFEYDYRKGLFLTYKVKCYNFLIF